MMPGTGGSIQARSLFPSFFHSQTKYIVLYCHTLDMPHINMSFQVVTHKIWYDLNTHTHIHTVTNLQIQQNFELLLFLQRTSIFNKQQNPSSSWEIFKMRKKLCKSYYGNFTVHCVSDFNSLFLSRFSVLIYINLGQTFVLVILQRQVFFLLEL